MKAMWIELEGSDSQNKDDGKTIPNISLQMMKVGKALKVKTSILSTPTPENSFKIELCYLDS